jgi:hypothetical protein
MMPSNKRKKGGGGWGGGSGGERVKERATLKCNNFRIIAPFPIILSDP